MGHSSLDQMCQIYGKTPVAKIVGFLPWFVVPPPLFFLLHSFSSSIALLCYLEVATTPFHRSLFFLGFFRVSHALMTHFLPLQQELAGLRNIHTFSKNHSSYMLPSYDYTQCRFESFQLRSVFPFSDQGKKVNKEQRRLLTCCQSGNNNALERLKRVHSVITLGHVEFWLP